MALFSKCFMSTTSSMFIQSIFQAVVPFHLFSFTLGAIQLMTLPNAGGHSERSEALSFEVLHRILGCELCKAEMEIKYLSPNWKKTDYLIQLRSHKVAVSVTRAVGYPNPQFFDESAAVELLKKKLSGICISSLGVVDEDKWERQILHIFTQTPQAATYLKFAYHSLPPILRGNTIVICTVAGNHKWIFS
ncbi:uncharacterized protein MONOS_11067 [Monocercomonoides exilis]|uniref:uncharacterized protein n=1 Tax=Monocercomonoides exilis TaxID=2049356 RepID=UPI003559F715|nr:hypothetical protein MONOS_11067 [Monocercomonoides exilis]|eukprot:MONOS_11067.1-p1 / transcript=MONOS_11067.1 / gene=MONOS_11067 / organism=Monocercomonoides_exilis_PA203 / gene_product=AAC-rich mRNA clone AAC4 protein / transcript_product=AAC-rich mRNA clone AAC4 protein / location=Mono_scaffold00534:18490-19182(-) / protein_length=189 / sequence_SO=supercontig / SO=protein_coding / is_pseudo=false